MRVFLNRAAMVLAGLSLSACGGGGGSSPNTGTVTVAITDASIDDYDEALLLLNSVTEETSKFNSRTLDVSRSEDRWIISRLGAVIGEHDKAVERNNFSASLEAVHTFFRSEFCDWYLEIIKPRLRSGGSSAASALAAALHCKRTLLKLFHPYIPFVT